MGSNFTGLTVKWYDESTSVKIVNLFKSNNALICLFSLGAVIRLIAPHIKDKKTDPAVIVIDDKAQFVISVLSGHLGGANKLSNEILTYLPPLVADVEPPSKKNLINLMENHFRVERISIESNFIDKSWCFKRR